MYANLIHEKRGSNHCTSVAVALPFALPLALADTAAAQKAKKLSYDQAWAKCMEEVDRTVPRDQQTSRATAGGGCMRYHGYRLKKKK